MSALASSSRSRAASRPTLRVDLGAIAANTRLFSERAAGEVMAVVKADGFGHGALAVARTALANGATWLGVTSIDEGLALRADGVRAPMLSWLNPVDADFAAAATADIDVAVASLEHLAGVAAGGPARVHLHVDCGMARDGCPPELWRRLCVAARRAERAGRIQVVGLMGHLGCADDPGDACNSIGRTRFAWALDLARATGLRPANRHLAATAATLTDPRSHHTMSRIGAGLVGIDPSGTVRLQAAMTLTAPVVSVRPVPVGTPVGYGHTWRTPAATRLALVPLGYADGLPRLASGKASVLVGGSRCPVVGRISMDQLVVDVGSTDVQPGDRVTVFGAGDNGEPTVDEWAGWAGTLPHEIVTGIGSRVSRSIRPAVLRSV